MEDDGWWGAHAVLAIDGGMGVSIMSDAPHGAFNAEMLSFVILSGSEESHALGNEILRSRSE
jgi:hypothetical protein